MAKFLFQGWQKHLPDTFSSLTMDQFAFSISALQFVEMHPGAESSRTATPDMR